MERFSQGIVEYEGRNFCHICRIPVEFQKENQVQQHVTGPVHHKSGTLFKKYFAVNKLNLKCKTCDLELSWSEIEQHRKLHKIIPWEKPILTLYINSISKVQSQTYFCNLCKTSFSNWSPLCAHFEDQNHVTLRSENPHFPEMAEKCDLTEDTLYIMITNYTTFLDLKNFHCAMCSVKFCRIKELLKHFQEAEHNEKRHNYNVKNLERTLEIPENYQWMKGPYRLEISNGRDTIYCNRCDASLKSQNALVGHLRNHCKSSAQVESMFGEYAATLEDPGPEEMEALKARCLSLDVAGSVQEKKPKFELYPDIRAHIAKCRYKIKQEFEWMIIPYKLKFQRDVIFCSHCEVHMKNQGAVDGHLRRHVTRYEEHKMMRAKYQDTLDDSPIKTDLPIETESSETTIPAKEEEPESNSSEISSKKAKYQIPDEYKWMMAPFGLKIYDNWIYCGYCCTCLKKQSDVEGHLKCHLEEKETCGNTAALLANFTPKPEPESPELNSHEEIFDLDPQKKEDLKLCSWSMSPRGGKKLCWICSSHVRDSLQSIYEHWRTHAKVGEYLETQGRVFQEGVVSAYEHTAPGFICGLCDESLERVDENGIQAHVQKVEHLFKKMEHLKRSKKLYEDVVFHCKADWYNVSKFCCAICRNQAFFEQPTFALHLDGEEHKENLENGTEKLAFDNCVPCRLLWFGRENLYLEHKDSEEHRQNLQLGKRDFELSEEAQELLSTMDRNITGLLIRSSLVFQVTMEKRKGVSKRLEGALRSYFPDGKVHFFGPRAEGLATFENCIGIFFDIDDVYYKGLKSEEENEVMNKVMRSLVGAKEDWDILEILKDRRTTTLRVKDLTSELICDISFKDGIDVENSKTVRKFCQALPLCASMILILQQWFLQNDMPAYCQVTSWYVIFYLQNIGVLPRITEIISEEKTISGWQTGSIKSIPVAENGRSLKEMILGFFVFYSEFKYKENVASPLTGEIWDKALFKKEEQQLAACAESHLSTKLPSETDFVPFPVHEVMCLQNPIALSHNLVENFDKASVHRFKLLCMKSVEFLIESSQEKAAV